MTRIVVVGLGLIGGSIALSARAHDSGVEWVGIDVAEVIASPAAALAVHHTVDAVDEQAVRAALRGASLAVLATPVQAIAQQLEQALALADVVTDCGSTKRVVVAAAARSPRASRFVPGHPMAGAPEGGLERARADLFRGQRWLLCPEGSDADALARVEALVRRLGAVPVHMGAGEHDRAVALTSHVPQLLASVLAVMADRHSATFASGPAFARLTTGAGGPESMWRDIFDTNADAVALLLREIAGELGRLAEELERTPAAMDRTLELLAAARALLQRDG